MDTGLKSRAMELLMRTYGPDNPKRVWAFLLTAFLVLAFPRATRRWGWAGFLISLFLMVIFDWLKAMMVNFTPSR